MATIAAAPRVRSFTNTYTTSFSMSRSPTPSSCTRNPKYKTIKEFRLQLARELIGDYCSRRHAGCHGGAIVPLQLQHFATTISGELGPRKVKRGRCARCYQHRKRADSQCFCRECSVWLCHGGDMRSCARCYQHRKRADSQCFCRECSVWLCHGGDMRSDCFYLWHKIENTNSNTYNVHVQHIIPQLYIAAAGNNTCIQVFLVCVCVQVCVHVCVCAQVCVHVCVCVCVCAQVCVIQVHRCFVCVHVFKQMNMNIHFYVYIHSPHAQKVYRLQREHITLIYSHRNNKIQTSRTVQFM